MAVAPKEVWNQIARFAAHPVLQFECRSLSDRLRESSDEPLLPAGMPPEERQRVWDGFMVCSWISGVQRSACDGVRLFVAESAARLQGRYIQERLNLAGLLEER